jgi:hypothetical protein
MRRAVLLLAAVVVASGATDRTFTDIKNVLFTRQLLAAKHIDASRFVLVQSRIWNGGAMPRSRSTGLKRKSW